MAAVPPEIEFAEAQREHGNGHASSGPLVEHGGRRCDRVHAEDVAGVGAGPDGTNDVPPHDDEAEVAVLGSMMLDPEAAERVAAILRPSHFYRAANAEAFSCLAGRVQRGEPLDVVLVREQLQKSGRLEAIGGTAFLTRLPARVPSAANAEYYARIVRDLAHRRAVAGAAVIVQKAELTGDAQRRASAHEHLVSVRDESERTSELRAVTLTDVEAAVIPRPEAFVADDLVVRQRLTLLVAAPKTGKSAALMQLAKCVATGLGEFWLGSSFTGNRAPVIYLTAEGGLAMVQERSHLIPPNVEIRDVHVVAERPFPRLDTARGLVDLSRLIRKTNAGLVLVDPLVSFRNVADENDNAEAQRFAEGLLAFIAEHDVAMVLAHHPGRAATAEGTSGSLGGGRGASALFAAADAEIALRKDSKSDEIHATFSKRYGRPIEPGRRLRIDPETFTLENLGDLGGTGGAVGPDGVTPARATATLIDFEAALQPVGTWRSTSELRAALAPKKLSSASAFRDRVKVWAAHLGDRLEVVPEPGPHGQKRYRLRPLAERAAHAAGKGDA